MRTSIAIVADFDPGSRSHLATNEAVAHGAAAVGREIKLRWIGTGELAAPDGVERLSGVDAIWVGPGSPYRSMAGALSAIRLARERGLPLLGTCGGFQHLILEYARHVLGFPEAEHEESSPGAKQLFISRLACSLVGRTMTLRLDPGSLLARVYGKLSVEEEYLCRFGVNPEWVNALRSGGLRVTASDAEGEVRAVELAGHAFFVGTLFLPQHRSTRSNPHPLVTAFLRSCSG